MNSDELTKAQVAGIIANELKRNYVWLQCFLLTAIGLIIVNLVPSTFTQIVTLLIGAAQLAVLYFIYNSNRNKITEFKQKYGEGILNE